MNAVGVLEKVVNNASFVKELKLTNVLYVGDLGHTKEVHVLFVMEMVIQDVICAKEQELKDVLSVMVVALSNAGVMIVLMKDA